MAFRLGERLTAPVWPRAVTTLAFGLTALIVSLAPSLASAQESTDDETELDPNRFEVGAVPGMGYSSDEGVGVAFAGSLAKFAPGHQPFFWHISLLGYLAINAAPGGGIEFPNADLRLRLDLPGVFGPQSRLQLQAKFNRYKQAGYHGFGNATDRDPARLQKNPRYYAYEHIAPNLEGFMRVRVGRFGGGKQEVFGGLMLAYHLVEPFVGSKLEADLDGSGGAETQRWLVGTSPFFAANGTLGFLWDSRDHELVPSRGTFTEVSLRGGAGLDQPFVFGALNLTARFYLTVVPEYLVLAARGVVELMFGDVPLLEMPRSGGLSNYNMTGGPMSVRGVAPQRLLGKIKALGNLELRSKWLRFNIAQQRFVLGGLVFGDLARVWATWERRPDRDGDRLAFATGIGGGVRLQWGEAFMLRCDFAYSLSDETPGFYLNINHIF